MTLVWLFYIDTSTAICPGLFAVIVNGVKVKVIDTAGSLVVLDAHSKSRYRCFSDAPTQCWETRTVSTLVVSLRDP